MYKIITTITFIVLSSFILLTVSSCKKEQKSFKQIEISFKKEGELDIYKANSDSIIAKFNIEIAETNYERQRGLMDRNSMKDREAMLFIFQDMQMRSFYMKNTYISLDIIYFDNNKTIVSIQKNAKPLDETSLPSEAPAKYVLEINGGLSRKLNIAIGDKMSFTKLKINK